jgi:hypothetical protein
MRDDNGHERQQWRVTARLIKTALKATLVLARGSVVVLEATACHCRFRQTGSAAF